MNKTLLLTGASAFALMLGVSAPAFAIPPIDGAQAEAEGTSEGNYTRDRESRRENLIDNSFNGGATGIVHDQQNNGDNNAVNAATAVHADVTGGTGLETGARASSTSDDNESNHDGFQDDRNNEILDTMNGFVGSATIQQNNGDNNAINAATALDGVSGDTTGVVQNVSADAKTVDGITDEDESSEVYNLIDPSFTGAAGVFTVQQNNGDGNAISAATSAFGVTGDAGGLTQDASASADADGNLTDTYKDNRDNLIIDSFNGDFAGVATVQQNNGDANAMSTATAVAAVGGNAGDLTQHAIANGFSDGTRGNTTDAFRSERDNIIGGPQNAFQGAHGVITVQQNNGDANAISAANAVAGHLGAAGNIHQGTGVALGFSGVAGNNTDDAFGLRGNLINNGSFNGTSGAVTVQQNNGDANSMGAATAVTGITGESGSIDQHARNGFFLTGSGWNATGDDLNFGLTDRDNTINDSMNNMSGVVTVQQNNGNANNLGAATSVIGVGGASGDVLQGITAGTGASGSAFNRTEALNEDRGNLIDPSFEDFEGIVTVQQNNGDANNMVALTAATLTNGAGTVGQDISADNLSLENKVKAEGSDRENNILNSFNNLKGIATAQQSNGDANSIVAMTSLVAVAGDSGDTSQTIKARGASEGNYMSDKTEEGRSIRGNLIQPSFSHVEGILTVQQNNGSGNAMTSATGVVANMGGANDTAQDIKAGGNVGGNKTRDEFSSHSNLITRGSFQALRGIATVQQNNGDGNVMSAATAVAGNTGGGKLDDVEQSVGTKGRVIHARAKDLDDTGSNFKTKGKRSNSLALDSFNGANGIVTVQQNNGSNNVIAAATGVRAETESTITSRPGQDDVSRQTATTMGMVIHSKAKTKDLKVDDPARGNILGHSIKGGVNGIFTVQQNNGDNNVMGAATAVAANINTADDIDSAMDNNAKTFGMVKRNKAQDKYTRRPNAIVVGVFNGAAGIVTVQQNNGNNNVMGSATGVVANVETGFRFGKAVEADATGKAKVKDNMAKAEDVNRFSIIEEAMNGTQGVMTLQQNNGDNNVMGASTDVVATTELPGFGPAASTSSLSATVSGNTATWDVDGGSSTLSNTVLEAFTGAAGVMTVQQNNGNNNAMGSAVTVVANGINFGFNGQPN